MWIKQTDELKGLPTRTPEMATVLMESEDHSPDESLPLEWSDNRTCNVPEVLGEWMVENFETIAVYEDN